MMRAGIYARVSSKRQAQDQTIEQQLARGRTAIEVHGWELSEAHIYRDDGYSGARLSRPGLDRLRDDVALAEVEVVVITAPDRLARKYLHQVLLVEEFERYGVRVEFVERPMSNDPHDQLLLQIRGAVAEYERTLITDRLRRGKLAKLRAGQLLPWTRGHYGYYVDPQRPRDPVGVRRDDTQAVVVAHIFAAYLEDGATLYAVGKALERMGVLTPRGRPYWSGCSVRAILRDPTYTGLAYGNRYHCMPAKGRVSPLLPLGPGHSHVLRDREEWVPIPVPAIVSEEVYQRVQDKLAHNQQRAARNTHQEYLLRGHVSCGLCRLTAGARTTPAGYGYYVCRGRTDRLRISQGQQCTARYVPAQQLDDLVWTDLCAMLNDPQHIAVALDRVHTGAWLPQELQARQANTRQAIEGLERQQERLLTAYLADILTLPEFERKRRELEQKRVSLQVQQHHLTALVQQRIELAQVAASIEGFCAQVRAGLDTATFQQRRMLVELLIDQVVVTEDEVEIRYVVPISQNGARQPFCQLRLDYRGGLSQRLYQPTRGASRFGTVSRLLQPRAPAPGAQLPDTS
jgi:site-specific DNA recombinase